MDELSSKLKKGERDVKEFQKAVVGAFKDSAKEIAGFAFSTGKSLASLATGNIGIANQAKRVLEFRDSVAALAVMAGKGEESLGGLRDQIHAVSKSSVQMQDDVTAALAAFVEKTGDIETARKNLELYGKVATATGASIKDIALVGVELSDKLGIKDQGQSLAILAALSKSGAIELSDLATKGPKLLAAAASAGAKDELGLRKTGALAQVYARGFGGTGSAASVTTAAERTFSDLSTHGKALRALGVDGRGDKFEVLKEVIRRTGGDDTALRKIFGVIAMRGVNVMAREFKDTGGFGTFDRFQSIAPPTGMIDQDFKLRAGTGAAKLRASQNAIFASSDQNLGDSFERLARHADKLAGAFDFATRHLALTAGVLGISVVGKNVGSSLLGVALRGGHIGVQQVYVTGAAPGAISGGPGAAGAAGTVMGRAFSAVAAAGIGYTIGTIIDQAFGISSGVSKSLVDNKNRQIEAAADGKLGVRARGVKHYEGQGLSHGAAIRMQYEGVEAAQKILDRLNSQVNQVNVTIVNDRVANVESNGTRSEASVIRRGMDIGEKARL